jgi:hypothetical protein
MIQIKEYKESLIKNPFKEVFYTFFIDSKIKNFKRKDVSFSDEFGHTYFGEVIEQKYALNKTYFKVREKHKIPECMKSYVDLTT